MGKDSVQSWVWPGLVGAQGGRNQNWPWLAELSNCVLPEMLYSVFMPLECWFKEVSSY